MTGLCLWSQGMFPCHGRETSPHTWLYDLWCGTNSSCHKKKIPCASSMASMLKFFSHHCFFLGNASSGLRNRYSWSKYIDTYVCFCTSPGYGLLVCSVDLCLFICLFFWSTNIPVFASTSYTLLLYMYLISFHPPCAHYFKISENWARKYDDTNLVWGRCPLIDFRDTEQFL